ncbi:CYTH domain-containing protein [Leucobacter luti]|uniref:CYTH domain-containing protein n=1 Tax=Leucobacter luti TaxID=340320 RepID=UPI001C691C44|nr:CYTH domain-containing protein [Leucobacter luti]
MTSEAGVEALEIERKYEVAVDAHLPTAERFARAGFSATEPVIFHLAAQYFDTPDEALARAGIAVRVRTGGSDAGWHVKRREPGECGNCTGRLPPRCPQACWTSCVRGSGRSPNRWRLVQH